MIVLINISKTDIRTIEFYKFFLNLIRTQKLSKGNIISGFDDNK